MRLAVLVADEMGDDAQKSATRRAKGVGRRAKLGPGRRAVDRRAQGSKTWQLRGVSHLFVMEGEQTASRGKRREGEEERDEEARGRLRWAMRMSLVGWRRVPCQSEQEQVRGTPNAGEGRTNGDGDGLLLDDFPRPTQIIPANQKNRTREKA